MSYELVKDYLTARGCGNRIPRSLRCPAPRWSWRQLGEGTALPKPSPCNPGREWCW